MATSIPANFNAAEALENIRKATGELKTVTENYQHQSRGVSANFSVVGPNVDRTVRQIAEKWQIHQGNLNAVDESRFDWELKKADVEGLIKTFHQINQRNGQELTAPHRQTIGQLSTDIEKSALDLSGSVMNARQAMYRLEAKEAQQAHGTKPLADFKKEYPLHPMIDQNHYEFRLQSIPGYGQYIKLVYTGPSTFSKMKSWATSTSSQAAKIASKYKWEALSLTGSAYLQYLSAGRNLTPTFDSLGKIAMGTCALHCLKNAYNSVDDLQIQDPRGQKLAKGTIVASAAPVLAHLFAPRFLADAGSAIFSMGSKVYNTATNRWVLGSLAAGMATRVTGDIAARNNKPRTAGFLKTAETLAVSATPLIAGIMWTSLGSGTRS